MVKKGDSVELVEPEAVKRFGPGPFNVLATRPDLNAVELEELGTVNLTDISDPIIEEEVDPGAVEKSASKDEPASDEERAVRIEAITGTLLSHVDPNVRMAMREILRLLWGDE